MQEDFSSGFLGYDESDYVTTSVGSALQSLSNSLLLPMQNQQLPSTTAEDRRARLADQETRTQTERREVDKQKLADLRAKLMQDRNRTTANNASTRQTSEQDLPIPSVEQPQVTQTSIPGLGLQQPTDIIKEEPKGSMAPPSRPPSAPKAHTEPSGPKKQDTNVFVAINTDDVADWLQLTGYHDEAIRSQKLATHRRRTELQKKQEELNAELAELERLEAGSAALPLPPTPAIIADSAQHQTLERRDTLPIRPLTSMEGSRRSRSPVKAKQDTPSSGKRDDSATNKRFRIEDDRYENNGPRGQGYGNGAVNRPYAAGRSNRQDGRINGRGGGWRNGTPDRFSSGPRAFRDDRNFGGARNRRRGGY